MSSLPNFVPPYLRPKLAAFRAQCSRSEIFNRLAKGRYRSIHDGKNRLIETASIEEDQQRLADKAAQAKGAA